MKHAILWIAVLAAAVAIGVILGSASTNPAGADVFPEFEPFVHDHGAAGQHGHDLAGLPDVWRIQRREIERLERERFPDSFELLHDDPSRPDESHDPQAPAVDGTYRVDYDDGTTAILQVMGNQATYTGPNGETRLCYWDPHGGGGWRDYEEDAWSLHTNPVDPPEFPEGWACLFDFTTDPYTVKPGIWR